MRNVARALVLRCLAVCAICIPQWATGASPYLNQGFAGNRANWYSTSQGSQLVPWEWFKALERPGSTVSFNFDSLARFGYLPPLGRSGKNTLPVGVVVDAQYFGAREWVGLTCAACHTSEIKYRGAMLRIDGGPADADLYALLDELNAALGETKTDLLKFTRFAKAVLGSQDTVSNRTALSNELRQFVLDFDKFVRASKPASPWGPARADAFGMIFNRVTSIDLCIDGNNEFPNAPVSYPFLWSTWSHDITQWNGSADNDVVLGRLGRNVGQVLGVFAKIDLGPVKGYPSTAHIRALNDLEWWIKDLKAPPWPDRLFGAIDPVSRKRGSALYLRERCDDCHKLVPSSDQSRRVKVKMIPLDDIGTDRAMALAADPATAKLRKSGILAGTNDEIFGGKPFGPEAPALDLVRVAAVGAILSPFAAATGECPSSRVDRESTFEKRSARFRNRMREQVPELFRAYARLNLAAYKARPLNGIWATAPYLHNGSVPNLKALLSPVDDRPKLFWVGSREFDPKDVGFVSTKDARYFLFDTTVSGNYNTGHTWGTTTLTPTERDDLIEYLKSL